VIRDLIRDQRIKQVGDARCNDVIVNRARQSEEQKSRLAERIAHRDGPSQLPRRLGFGGIRGKSAVSVTRKNQRKGLQGQSLQADILSQPEKLYKKPGYTMRTRRQTTRGARSLTARATCDSITMRHS
jgi:hypothetical protein